MSFKLIMEQLNTKDVKQLEKYILKLNEAYFNKEPLVSDIEYDKICDKLRSMSPESSVLKNIGHLPEKGIHTVELPISMPSLDKVKPDTKALTKFIKETMDNNLSITISEKLDGISLLLEKTSSGWVCMSRGNGVKGQDVSSNLVNHITLPDNSFPYKFIRGEVILPQSSREKLNTDKNLRTIANGIINCKKPKKEILKYIRFVGYSIPHSDLTPLEQFQLLSEYKVITPKYMEIKIENSSQEVFQKTLIEWKNNSKYDIDGIVLGRNVVEINTKNKNPKQTVAFKMPLDEQKAVSEVVNIIWNESKDKYLKPIVEIKPVVIGGTTIKKVTGINAKYIQRNMINTGAVVEVIRSGDVIPKIVSVIKKAKCVSYPEVDAFGWNSTCTDFVVYGSDTNSSELLYLSKTLGIKYINTSLIEKLFNIGIDNPEKFISITKQQLLSLPNVKEKSASKILESINTSLKEVKYLNLMVATNVFGRNLGKSRLELIFDDNKIYDLFNLSDDTIYTMVLNIKGFSITLTKQFIEKLRDFQKFLINSPKYNNLLLTKINEDDKEDILLSEDESLILTGETYVFTGGIDKELKHKLETLGAKIEPRVSKNTSGLIKTSTEDTISSKEKNALKYKVPVLSVSDVNNKLLKF